MSSLDHRPHGAPLSGADLHDRIKPHVHALYNNFSSLIKSAVFAAAAVTFIHIVTNKSFEYFLIRSILLSVSIIFSIITFMKWDRGSLVANERQNAFDFILPAFVGISEIILFIVLDPELLRGGTDWIYWYLAFFAHSALACALVYNRLAQTSVETGYCNELHALASRCREWMRNDLIGTSLCAVTSLLLYVLASGVLSSLGFTLLIPGADSRTHVVIGILFAITGLAVIAQAAREFKEILSLSRRE